MAKPLKLRRLKAEMVLKDLTLTSVAQKARLNLSIASDLLNGRRVDPKRLSRLIAAIDRAPMPQEVNG